MLPIAKYVADNTPAIKAAPNTLRLHVKGTQTDGYVEIDWSGTVAQLRTSLVLAAEACSLLDGRRMVLRPEYPAA